LEEAEKKKVEKPGFGHRGQKKKMGPGGSHDNPAQRKMRKEKNNCTKKKSGGLQVRKGVIRTLGPKGHCAPQQGHPRYPRETFANRGDPYLRESLKSQKKPGEGKDLRLDSRKEPQLSTERRWKKGIGQ